MRPTEEVGVVKGPEGRNTDLKPVTGFGHGQEKAATGGLRFASPPYGEGDGCVGAARGVTLTALGTPSPSLFPKGERGRRGRWGVTARDRF